MNKTMGLFKYLNASKLHCFEHCLVLLTPPICLNDPWDFLPKGRIPFEDEILKAWQENERDTELSSSVIHLPTEFASRAQQDRLTATRAHLTSTEVVARSGEHYQKAISGIYGIVSLTEAHLSRLMWAHYAQSHAGFVAEFAADKEVEADGFTRRKCAVGLEFAVKVKYPPSFQQPSLSKDAENVLEVCCTKHPLWEYEKEWRIIAPLEKSITCPPFSITGSEVDKWYCLPFDPKNLRRVIFGMRMKPEVKQQLCCMLNQENFRHVQKQTTGINPETGELVLHPFESA